MPEIVLSFDYRARLIDEVDNPSKIKELQASSYGYDGEAKITNESKFVEDCHTVDISGTDALLGCGKVLIR